MDRQPGDDQAHRIIGTGFYHTFSALSTFSAAYGGKFIAEKAGQCFSAVSHARSAPNPYGDHNGSACLKGRDALNSSRARSYSIASPTPSGSRG